MDPRRQILERCVRTCSRRAWAVACSLLRDHDDAMDAVQQAFLVAARKLDRIPDDDPWPWFGVVVAHEARNLRRKKRPATNRLGEGTDMQAPEEGDSDPLVATQRSETRSLLRAALNALPRAEREAIVLTHMAGMSHAVAAEALGIPRQTLSAQVGRALDRLGRRLGREPRGLARSLAVLPIAAPRGGWSVATESWTRAALSALPSSATAATTVLGGIAAMSSKTALVVTLTAVLGLGFLGGSVVQDYLQGEPEASNIGLAPAIHGASRSRPGSPTLRSAAPPASGDVAALRREVDDLRERLARAQARSESLAHRLAELSGPRAGPTFTFGRMGQLEAVLKNDWLESARAAKVIEEGVRTVLECTERGEEVPVSVRLRLQENADRMRKYEFRSYGKMPTSAKYNGENTHPITMANLLAAMLEDAGRPLNAEQIARVNELGLAFEGDYARLRDRFTDAMPRVERILQEYLLKGRFIDAVVALLTPEQRDAVVPPGTHRVTGLDINSPTQMIAYTSPVLVGASIEEIRDDLRALLVKKLGLEGAEVAALEGPLDTWAHQVREILKPVPATRVRYYTFDEGAVAGHATVQLTYRLLEDLRLTDLARKTLMDDHGFYIPRIVKP